VQYVSFRNSQISATKVKPISEPVNRIQ